MKTCDQPRHGWTTVLQRQPARIVEGRPEGGYADTFEIICCDCGDHPDLDCCEVSPELQRVRGPYPIADGIEGYEKHIQLYQQPGRGHRGGGGLCWLPAMKAGFFALASAATLYPEAAGS